MYGTNGLAFLEIKGTTTDTDLTFADFVTKKAQSINAELRVFGKVLHTRYLLSQVFALPGKGMSVHWFNVDERNQGDLLPGQEAVLHIATGLAQFLGQIRNAGYDVTGLLNGTFVLPDQARRGNGFFIEPKPEGDFVIGVSYVALRLFVDISRYLLKLRLSGSLLEPHQEPRAITLSRRLSNLRSFFDAPDAAWRRLGERPVYTYSTGIFVMGPRDHQGE